jgi:hypothetical protein
VVIANAVQTTTNLSLGSTKTNITRSLQRVAAILEPRRKMEPRRRPGTNLEHAASSHGRSHFNPDYRPRSRAPLLPPLAPCINSVPSNAVLAGFTRNFFLLFSIMEPKCLLFGRWEAGSDYFIFPSFGVILWRNLGTIMDGDVDDDLWEFDDRNGPLQGLGNCLRGLV